MGQFVIIATTILMLAGNSVAAEEAPTYDTLLKSANEAFEAEDWRAVAKALDAAQELRPYSQFVTRNRVLAYSMLGEFARAESIVNQYADHGLSLRLAGHPGFEKLTARTEFAPIRDRMETNLQPAGDSSVVMEIANNGLLPETYARTKKEAYVGSVRTGQIVRADGAVFATAPGGVYDVELSGKALWAAANSTAPYEKSADSPAKSAIISYSLANGSETAAVTVGDEKTIIGDLEITPAGIVASDSLTPRLFVLRVGATESGVLVADDRFVNLQGLAYDKRRKAIFVADYMVGLFSVDLTTGVVTKLANPAGEHLGGIDGLYLYKGDLVGIQNGTSPQRIVTLKLNRSGDTVEALTVQVQNHPQWNEPTNGKVVGNDLHYVATSNWPAYGADGAEQADVARAPVRIMSVRLKP